MVTDPHFYLAAIPAVLLFGVAKGGFGGGLGIVAVPLMALVVSPVQAAAILLPILCLMDLVSLWAYRGRWVTSELRTVLPWTVPGIAVGALLFGFMSSAVIRLLLGCVALVFTIHYWLQRRLQSGVEQAVFPPPVGMAAAAAAGFTSFIAHAGGPPISMYLLRRRLDRTAFVATTVVFFAVVNYLKLIPYAWLGQLDSANLQTSLVLAPLAPLGIGLGVWLHNHVTDRIFFQVAYTLLFLVGLRLVFAGVTELSAAAG